MNLHSQYYTESLYDNRLNFNLQILKFLDRVRVLLFRIRPSLIRRQFKTGFIDRLNRQLAQIYLKSEGFKSLLGKHTFDEANALHKAYETKLFAFLSLYSSLEKVNFFRNSETRDLTDKIMLNHYEIEAALRQIAFQNPVDNSEEYLKDAASQLSKQTVQNLHAL